MAKALTGVFFLGLMLVLIGYGRPGTQSGSLLLSAGWFGVLWPGLTLILSVPAKAAESVGRNLAASPDPERRRMLSCAAYGAAAAVAGPTAMLGIAQGGKDPVVRRVSVPLEGRHPGLHGLRIVQISDLHLDRWTDPERVERLVASVNRLRPHLVALTGDLADDPVERLCRAVSPLARLSAPNGRYFVTGNHEYRPAAGGVSAWLQEVERLGFCSLVNDCRMVSVNGARLAVAGVSDYDAAASLPSHASRPAAAAQGADRADFRILLAHQPRSLFEAAAAGFDLQLSGHTHGGQCFPAHLMVRLSQPVLSGLHRCGGLHLYVSAGVGTWGAPVRLGAPAEISLLTLCRSSRGRS